MRASLQTVLRWMGRAGIAFIFFLLLFFALDYFAPLSGVKILAAVGLFVTGLWLAIRLLRTAVWRLRNRLIVTYMFIAVVPIVLIAALAAMGGYLLINQLAVYLVTSELDRRIESLDTATDSLVRTAAPDRAVVMRRMTELFYSEHNPGIEIVVRDRDKVTRYPDNGTLPAPRRGWKETRGVLLREGKIYAWSHRRTETGDVTVTAPLTGDFLAGLVPNLGAVNFSESAWRPRNTRVYEAYAASAHESFRSRSALVRDHPRGCLGRAWQGSRGPDHRGPFARCPPSCRPSSIERRTRRSR